MSGYGVGIFEQHAAKLAASGISDEVAREREYRSADTKAQLERAGFGPAQRNVPALIMPIWNVLGEKAGAQVRPDQPRMLNGKPAKYETRAGQKMMLDVPRRVRPHLDDPHRPLIITEGPLKADSAVTAGLDAVALLGVWSWRGTNEDGGKVALPDWEYVALNGRDVFIAFDSDVMLKPEVHAALGRFGAFLSHKGANVAYIYLPHGEHGTKIGLDDWLAAGHTGDELFDLATPELRSTNGARPRSEPEQQPPPPRTLAEVETVLKRDFIIKDDAAHRAVLGAYAANRLPGDPVWLGIVGGSSRGKTEFLAALNRCPHIEPASHISGPAALLSLTSRREITAEATGGILPKIGDFGILTLKDLTTVLAMNRDKRAEVFAALREVFDGSWTRDAGVDGGRSATWTGKLGLIFGVTTAIDTAHALLSTMGERFVLIRVDVDAEAELAARAVDDTTDETSRRAQLADTVAGLLANLDYTTPPHPLEDNERTVLINLSTFVARARSPVTWDYRGELELVNDPEGPPRLAKALRQLHRGLRLIGLDPPDALDVIRKAGFDSIPKARAQVLDGFETTGATRTTTQIAKSAGLPTNTAVRRLTELAAHGLIGRSSGGKGKPDNWGLTTWGIELLEGTSPEKSSYGGSGYVVPAPLEVVKDPHTVGSDKTGELHEEPEQALLDAFPGSRVVDEGSRGARPHAPSRFLQDAARPGRLEFGGRREP